MIGVTHIQNRNSDCTAVSGGHTNTHIYGENYFWYWWYKRTAYQLYTGRLFCELWAWTPEWLSLNCMIYAFCIAAHVCGESTAHWWIPLQAINSAELCCLVNVLMSCWTNCGDSSEKTRETHIMLYCYGNRHSKIDDITGSQGMDHWSGALLVQCDGIPSPVVPLTKVRLDIFFRVCLSVLNKL